MDIWGNIVSHFKNKVDNSTFSLLKSVENVEYKDGHLYVSTPDEIFKEWLKSNFLDEITLTASKIIGQNLEVHILSKEDIAKKQKTVKEFEQQTEEQEIKEEQTVKNRKPYRFYNLNPKFVFSNLIVGSCNKIAYSACMSVAENLGRIYNPLFIYGGVGLGKTHLLHATAHYVLSKNPDANIIYTTADTFMSELISCMQNNSILSFRKRYRNVDLLLIDDVQFLGGKERTQIELYHIFNALHLIGKQVILSSDTPPVNIEGLQERLKSRFVSGLVVEVRAPDLDTKLSIIRKKAKEMNILIPHDVVLFIAKTVNTNVRELEGSLLKLKAYSEIMGRPITLDLTRDVLKDILSLKEIEELSIQKIQKEVANYFAVNLNEILGSSRKKKVATARQVAMYLSRYLTDKSLTEISKAFKKKDHTTVINAIEKVEKLMENDRKFKLTVEFLRDKILTI